MVFNRYHRFLSFRHLCLVYLLRRDLGCSHPISPGGISCHQKLFTPPQNVERKGQEGIIKEDQKLLKKVRKRVRELRKQTDTSLQHIYRAIKHQEEGDSLVPRLYLLIYDLLQDLIQSTDLIAEKSFDHVTNMHNPFKAEQRKQVTDLTGDVKALLKMVVEVIETNDDEALSKVSAAKMEIHKTIEDLLAQQSQGIRSGKYSKQNSLLFFSLMLETKDLVAVASRFVKIFSRAKQQADDETYLLLKQNYIYEK